MSSMAAIKVKVTKAELAEADMALLSGAERRRFDAMDAGGRPAFVTGRATLRRMLGDRLDMTPENVPLEQEGAGRVHLQLTDPVRPGFSVSHTHAGDTAYVAVATVPHGDIGVDIESKGRVFDWRRMAERRLGDEEKADLMELSDEDGHHAFLGLWTLKEAMVKLKDDKLLNVLRNTHIKYIEGWPRLLHQPAGWVGPVYLESQLLDAEGLYLGLATSESHRIEMA